MISTTRRSMSASSASIFLSRRTTSAAAGGAKHDMFDEGEPEPGAAALAAGARIDPIEALGQPRDMGGGDALAMVDHAEADQVRPGVGEPHANLSPGPAIFERVDDEV